MMTYPDENKLREYAALSNGPIIYCLTYERDTHRIAGVWAYLWLIQFLKTGDLTAFHPHALKLIKENLPYWRNPTADTDDYQLFLRGTGFNPQSLESLIQQAINGNQVLYLDKKRAPDTWQLSFPAFPI